MKSMMHKQRGLSLIELMVSLVVGMIVIAGSIMMFGPISRSTSDALRSSKLNTDLQAAVDVMANELRRAGYVSNVGAVPPLVQVSDGGACVLYAYQEPGVGAVTWGGFAFANNALTMIQGQIAQPADCTGGQAWTDPALFTVTALVFSCTDGGRAVEIELQGQVGAGVNLPRKGVGSKTYLRNTTCVTV